MEGEEKDQDIYFPSLLGHILASAVLLSWRLQLPWSRRSQLPPFNHSFFSGPIAAPSLCPFRPKGGNNFLRLLALGCFTIPSWFPLKLPKLLFMASSRNSLQAYSCWVCHVSHQDPNLDTTSHCLWKTVCTYPNMYMHSERGLKGYKHNIVFSPLPFSYLRLKISGLHVLMDYLSFKIVIHFSNLVKSLYKFPD